MKGKTCILENLLGTQALKRGWFRVEDENERIPSGYEKMTSH